jgi:uncharacterized cupin superfamily protein
MKKTLSTTIASLALLAGSATLASTALSTSAFATVKSHTMMAHTWHGTIGVVHAKMGTHESFTLKVGSKTYTVDYTTMTRFTMGSSKSIKAGGMISVTGTLSKNTITATKLSL